MFEMSYACEYHADAKLVRLGDGLLVAYASAGLDNGADAVACCKLYSIGKRKEAVGGQDKALGEAGLTGLLECYLGRAYAVGLAGANSYGMVVTHNRYSVGFHVLDYLPSELQVGHLGLARLDAGNALLGLDLFHRGIQMLHQHSAVDSYVLLYGSLGTGHVHLEHAEVLLGGKNLKSLCGI